MGLPSIIITPNGIPSMYGALKNLHSSFHLLCTATLGVYTTVLYPEVDINKPTSANDLW